MSVEYQNSILWRGEDPLKRKFQPKVDASKKVIRYFPGQAPKWSQDEKKKEEEEKRKLEEEKAKESRGSRRRRRDRDPASSAAVILEQREDAAATRLKRLRESSGAATVGTATERLARHRVIHEARVLEAADEDEKEEQAKKEEDEEKPSKVEPLDERRGGSVGVAELQIPMYDDISGDDADDVELRTLRRERAREAALQKRKQEEDVLKEELEEDIEDEDEDDEDSDESDSEDDPRRGARMKPVFVSKAQRETVKEREAQLKEEEAAQERKEERQKEKKAESKTLLVDTIRADDEAEAAGVNENDGSDIELIDDDDEKNEAEEYELWKIRELKRIKRDKEERLERQEELELIERRRRMTDAEREEDDRRMDSKASKRDDVKAFNFLQKYYHRGGFFQDKATTGEEPLYNRDYHEPTEEEKFDKQLLPKAMQLRRGQFGKKGQVKHTHLTEADTTDMSAAWSQHSKSVQKYQERMAGAKGVNNFSRPSGSRGPD